MRRWNMMRICRRQEIKRQYKCDFIQLEKLGSGAFGNVFKVQDRSDGGLYAVKVMQPPNNDPALISKMLEEIKTLKELEFPTIVDFYNGWVEMQQTDRAEDHPNDEEVQISTLLNDEKYEMNDSTEADTKNSDAGSTGTASRLSNNLCPVVYIQMELCKMSLEQILSERIEFRGHEDFIHEVTLRSSYLESFLEQLTLQLLEAISYIHENSLIHRDIKPGNIFLYRYDFIPRFKLGDFGLACWNVNSNDTGEDGVQRQQHDYVSYTAPVGTPLYAAPEQLKNTKYGPEVDIYSAGIVLFDASNGYETGEDRVYDIRKLREDISALNGRMYGNWFLKHLLLDMVQHDPHKRLPASDLLGRIYGERIGLGR